VKRVYATVDIHATADGWGIFVDGKPVRTPAKRELAVPTQPLAAAIAAEWDAQRPDIRPATMKLTRLAATVIDRTARQRDAVIAEIAGYAGTDLVCYRADHPPALAARQHATWQPLIDWAALRYDAPLAVTAGVIPLAQPQTSLKALAAAVAEHDDFRLTALHDATAACGSLVIALALVEGRLDAAAAFAAAQLDESFQIEAWGEDFEAAERRRNIAADIDAAGRFVALLARWSPAPTVGEGGAQPAALEG
jgi:chaperone required for assembly of F1-ATPase